MIEKTMNNGKTIECKIKHSKNKKAFLLSVRECKKNIKDGYITRERKPYEDLSYTIALESVGRYSKKKQKEREDSLKARQEKIFARYDNKLYIECLMKGADI